MGGRSLRACWHILFLSFGLMVLLVGCPTAVIEGDSDAGSDTTTEEDQILDVDGPEETPDVDQDPLVDAPEDVADIPSDSGQDETPVDLSPDPPVDQDVVADQVQDQPSDSPADPDTLTDYVKIS